MIQFVFIKVIHSELTRSIKRWDLLFLVYMFSGILPRLGNDIEIMSRAIDVNQWLEEWCRGEGFYISEAVGII